MIIRPATQGDIPQVRAIYAASVLTTAQSFELEAPSEADMAARFDAIVSAGHPYLVAESDDVVLGYCYAGPFRPRPAYAATFEHSVYVDGERRGAGIGRALMAALMSDLEAKGARQLIAVIGDPDATVSVSFHSALGFEMIGRMREVGRKFDRWVDILLMQRAIAGA